MVKKMKKKFPLLAAISLVLLITGCKKILIVHLFDASASAVNNADFVKEEQQVCHGIAEAVKSNDRYARIPVSSDITAQDPDRITSREKLHRECKNQPQPKGKGTFSCPGWQLAIELSDRYPEYRPLIVTQIQTDELEPFCASTLQTLSRKISDRKGKLIFVGSSNEGSKFNSNLWQELKTLPNTKFCQKNGRTCVTEAMNSLR